MLELYLNTLQVLDRVFGKEMKKDDTGAQSSGGGIYDAKKAFSLHVHEWTQRVVEEVLSVLRASPNTPNNSNTPGKPYKYVGIET